MSDVGSRDDERLAGVYGYLAYEVGSRVAAEQLAEAAFSRAVDERRASRTRAEPPRIALLRLAHRVVAAGRQEGPASTDDPAVSSELAGALGRLASDERTVLALRFGARVDLRDAAAVLGTSEQRARRLLSRGLRRLRTELDA